MCPGSGLTRRRAGYRLPGKARTAAGAGNSIETPEERRRNLPRQPRCTPFLPDSHSGAPRTPIPPLWNGLKRHELTVTCYSPSGRMYYRIRAWSSAASGYGDWQSVPVATVTTIWLHRGGLLRLDPAILEQQEREEVATEMHHCKMYVKSCLAVSHGLRSSMPRGAAAAAAATTN